MKFFPKIQIFGVALATLVAFGATACGDSDNSVSCNNKKAKNIVTDKIKDTVTKDIVKESPNLAERLSKMQISFDKVTAGKLIEDKRGGFEDVYLGGGEFRGFRFVGDETNSIGYREDELPTTQGLCQKQKGMCLSIKTMRHKR